MNTETKKLTIPYSSLQEQIEYSFKMYSDLEFLDVNNELFTYGQVYDFCKALSNTIYTHITGKDSIIGVLGSRSYNNYVGIYGVLLSGYAYVPINPQHPQERILQTIISSKCEIIVLCKEAINAFEKIADKLDPKTIICIDGGSLYDVLLKRFGQHKFVYTDSKQNQPFTIKKKALPNDLAYVIFTSGSTGVPKGVMVTQKNVLWYANYSIQRYGVTEEDRVSQSPDVSFDLSVHDLYISILSGASLHVLPEQSKIAPGKFIKEKKITFWTSVPSVVTFMNKLRMLKPNTYPDVRNTMFCGEALPVKSAEIWQKAMPNCYVENTYGPSECTVAVTNYHWRDNISAAESRSGIVSLGRPFPHQKIAIVDEQNDVLKDGEIGEICIAGPQVAKGYLGDPSSTEQKFVSLKDNSHKIWYKTGDLGIIDKESGLLYFEGRVDHQVKIRGYRIELQEIDYVIQQVTDKVSVTIAVKNKDENIYSSIYSIIEGEENKMLKKDILTKCRENLPEYMTPELILFINKIPLNANGKIDRKTLNKLYGTK